MINSPNLLQTVGGNTCTKTRIETQGACNIQPSLRVVDKVPNILNLRLTSKYTADCLFLKFILLIFFEKAIYGLMDPTPRNLGHASRASPLRDSKNGNNKTFFEIFISTVESTARVISF